MAATAYREPEASAGPSASSGIGHEIDVSPLRIATSRVVPVALFSAAHDTRFSDAMIRAIVDAGELSDPAARVLGDIIIRRRDTVVACRMARINLLDRSRASTGDDQPQLAFTNAAIRLNLAQRGAT